MAAFPAFVEALERLGRWGVTVLWGEGVIPEFAPGAGEEMADAMPWEAALIEVRKRLDGE